MAELNDRILAELQSINTNLSRGSPFARGTNTGTDMFNQLSNTTQGLVSNAGAMLSGSMDLTKAITAVTGALEIFPLLGPALSGIIKATSGELLNMNNSMIMAGRNGVGFSQNLFAYTKMLGEAGISFTNFNAVLTNSNKQIMGMGGSAQDSAEKFLQASAIMRNSGDVIKAQIMGIDFTEFQTSLISSSDLLKFIDGSRAETTKRLSQSAAEATIAIDDMARITGRSRQELQKDVDKAAQSRLIEMAKMSMSADELAAMQKSLPFMTQFGDGVANVFQELSVFGDVVTKEGREAIAGLNQAFPGLAEKMREMTQTLDPARRKELELEIQYLMGERLANKDSLRELNILATRREGWAVQLTEAITKSQNIGAGARVRYEQAGGDVAEFNRLTLEQAELRKKIADNILTLKQEGGAGAQLSQILRGLDVAVAAGNTAVAKYIAKFEEATGSAVGSIGDPTKLVDKIVSLQTAGSDKVDAIVAALTGYTGVDTDKTPPSERPNTDRYRGQAIDQPLFVNVVNGKDIGSPRNDGSFGAKGGSGSGLDKWMEDFGDGTLIQAHRREGMITEKQAIPFALDTLGSTGILNNMIGSLLSSVVTNQTDTSAIREMIATVEKIPSQMRMPNMPATSMDADERKILAEKLSELNTLMAQLKTAVEDGSRGTVKAVKSQNNLIA